MNTNIMMDIDPLNNFELTLENYPIQPSYPYPTNHPYKQTYPYQNPYQTVTDNFNDNGINVNINDDNNRKEDVKPIIDEKKKKLKGKQSNYWNKKIMDKDFAFYGCSVCNISYTDIKELDQHVQIHTNRMTSYDLRLKNIKKRKRIKKEKKKIKKEAKIKQETEIEIKPEDGYIGNELTIEYNGNNCYNNENNQNNNGNTHNNDGNTRNDDGNIPINRENTQTSEKTHKNENTHNNNENTHNNNGNTHNNDGNTRNDDGNTNNNNGNTHNNDGNTRNDDGNIHNNRENTNKNENTYNNNGNTHNNNENTHDNDGNTHNNNGNTHNNNENTHDNDGNTHNNNGNTHNSDGDTHKNNGDTHNNSENTHNNTENTHKNTENTHNNNGNNNNNSENNDNNSGNNDNIDINNGSKENKSMCSNSKDFINVYKCFGCDKQFALSYYLRIHVRSHTDEKPYPCNNCGQSFITASKLGRHNKRVHLSTRNQCRICYKYFNRFESLVAHFDKKHADDKLEGEPYDYNAILPYLKEVEDQMHLKESKPKVETLWPYGNPTQIRTDSQTHKPTDMVNVKTDEVDVLKEEIEVEVITDVKNENECEVILPQKYEFEIDVKNINSNIVVEDIKIDFEVKQEADDEDNDNFDDGQEPDMDVNLDGSVKDERHSESDSDYFPSEGWAASPRPASPPPTQRAECEICHKTFSSNSYLVVHMRTHTGEKPYTCYICNRGFITAGKMHRHVLTHEESWKGEDGIKPEGYNVKDDPDDDKSTVKKKVKQAKDKLLKKNKNVEKKYKRRPHACEYCQKRFLHIETLQVHKKSHEGEPLVYKCNFCLETQPDSATLAEHEATHVGPKPYLCTVCGKQYTKKETMVYHKKNHKSTEPSYVCDICSKRFRSQTKLQRHIASHSTERFVLRYECPVCAHMFHTRYHVQMHLNTHQKEGLIQEDNRSAILAMVLQNARKIPKSTENSTTNLSENIPMDERSRICNICGQIFQHFYYLEEHLKTHGSKIAVENIEKEEIKKYTCQICSKSFKLHYYLKLHSYTHTKEKPYICQQCGKGFITKGKLKRHLETHQGLKKYQCHICYKFFTRPSYLRIHVRTIHGTQDYNFREYTLGQGSLDQ